jgi:hypothetical protein
MVHNESYVDQGVFGAVARECDVPAYSHMSGYRNNRILVGKLSAGEAQPQFTPGTYLRPILDRPLSKEQIERIDSIMETRFQTGRDDSDSIPYVFTPSTDKSISDSRIEDDNTVVGMFTNLVWDASLEAEGGVFQDPFEWIRSTLEWASQASDVTLVLRTHPAEHTRRTNESVSEWVKSTIDVTDNILVLEPDSDVNTYELMNDLDAGIVFNSTTGIEMAYQGIPVVVAGETHYRNTGATFDPETTEEYDRFLDHIGQLNMSDHMLTRARRYAHFLFCRKHIELPLHRREQLHDTLSPGRESIDSLVDAVVTGGVVESGR